MQRYQQGYAVDGQLYYEMAGAGEHVILIHAGIANLDMWEAQWHALTEGYRVLRYDLRGFGRSAEGGASSTHRQDVEELMAELGIEAAHFIGCSLGGEIALDVALSQPERVKTLVLISATPSGFEMQGEPPAALFQMIAALQAGDIAAAARAQNEMSVTGVNRLPEAVEPSVREAIYQMTVAAFTRGGGLAERGDIVTPPAAIRLGDVQAPTLLVVGAADHSELHRAAAEMASGIPHAQKEIIVVENAAHLPTMERPKQLNEAVLNFLAAS